MKFKLIFFLLFFYGGLISTHSQTKNFSDLEVKYFVKLVQDSLNPGNFTTAEMILLCNKDNSYYFNPEMAKVYESLDLQVMTSNNVQEIAKNHITLPKIRHSAWKENNLITIISPVGKYNYSYKSDALKWQLLPEVKKIEKFNCNLAKTIIEGDIFYAWYTTEIPINDGPFKFKGLPGLIVNVYNKNKTIEIDAVNIEKKKVEIKRLNEALNIDLKNRQNYLSARDKYFKYPFENNFSKEIVQKKLEQLRKINVFLD